MDGWHTGRESYKEKSEDDGVAFHHIVASKGYRDNHQKNILIPCGRKRWEASIGNDRPNFRIAGSGLYPSFPVERE